MKVIFKGHFDVISGYGNSAVNICIGLEKHGVDVYPIAYDVDFELPREFTDLFTKKEPMKMDCSVMFAQPNELVTEENWMWRIPVRVGYTMWEQTRLSKDLWKYYKDYENFTELWVPCNMNKKPFGEITDKPIEVMGLGVDSKLFRYKNRDWNGPLKYCMNGALGYRKGSFIVIEAYRRLTEEHPDWDIELHLKTSQAFCSDIIKIAPNITLHRELFDLDGINEFYGNMHCMVAPSRGEGFHQPPLEFMSTGGVVITTIWGGPEMWADNKFCLTVGHEMESTVNKWGGAIPGSEWASPDPGDVYSQMETVYKERKLMKEIGKDASVYVAENFNWNIVTLKMKERLKWLMKNKGSRLKMPKSLLAVSRN